MRVLIRVGYGLAPIVVFGVVALSSGGGHHRLVVLALGVVIGVILGTTADGGAGLTGLKGRFARLHLGGRCASRSITGSSKAADDSPRTVQVRAGCTLQACQRCSSGDSSQSAH